MKSEFLISGIETGKLNAMVKNIMTQTGITEPEEAVRMMNSGELKVLTAKSKWTEKDGVIYFSVKYDGASGQELLARADANGISVTNEAKSIILSKSFKPGKPMIYNVAVLKGELFSDEERTTKNIRQEAKSRNLLVPNAVLALLIRLQFSNKELEDMGLYWIVTMHEPIKDSDDRPMLLGANRRDNGSWLLADYDSPDYEWRRSGGFAFVVSQVELVA